MAKCSHYILIPGHWEDNPDYDPIEEGFSGFTNSPEIWIFEYKQWTNIDIDLHRYKCTQCHEIMTY